MKRPVVWGFVLVLVLFLIRLYLYGSQLDEKCYLLDNKFTRTTQATVTGQIERIEPKPKSVYIYLNHVVVTLKKEPDTTYSLDHLLVISQQGQADSFFMGNTLQIYGELQKLLPATNPGQFDERSYYREKNIYYKMAQEHTLCIDSRKAPVKDWLFHFQKKCQNIYEACLSKKDAGVLSAMLLGDKASLDMNIKELYQRNGIGHILAISGVKTLCLVSPLSLESGVKWGFLRLHNAKKYIQNLCFKGQFLARCPPWLCGGKNPLLQFGKRLYLFAEV